MGSIISRNLSNSRNTILPHNANFSPTLKNIVHSSQNIQATGIFDSGATYIYFSADDPIVNVDLSDPKVKVGTATGQSQQSTGTWDLNLPQIPSGFPITGHIMPGFCHTLIGVGPLCDADCTVTLTRAAVKVRDARGTPVLTGQRKNSGPRLWIIALKIGEENLPRMPNTANRTTLEVYSACDLPSIEALIRYFYTAAGCPVRSTWLTAISAGNYSSWSGLTLANATKYCPSDTATIMGHLVQKRQGVQSTNPKIPATSSPVQQLPQVRSNEL